MFTPQLLPCVSRILPSVHRLVELRHKTRTVQLSRWLNVNIAFARSVKVRSRYVEHCKNQNSSSFIHSLRHHVAKQCLHALHWRHCRENIARLKFLVLRLGLLDLSHDQSSSDLFSLVFQDPLQRVRSTLSFRTFTLRNVVKELLLQHPLDFFSPFLP